jgi:2-(1,2-epoxy-1,2-dihydrophenyl)acetyl-CoA isomerase
MSESPVIIVETLGSVGRITLNRPQRLNAVNVEMGHELNAALARMEDDEAIRAVILTGAGRSFCAGDDLKGMESEGHKRAAGPDETKNYVYAPYRWTVVVNAMRRLPKPVMGADLRVASETANFAIPFVKWAMATGVNQLHYHVPLGIALELAFTGDSLDAARAERLGLVNRVVPDDQLDAAALEVAGRLAGGPTRSLGLTKAAIYRGWWQSLDQTFEHQAVAQAFAGLTEDRDEGRRAFAERRSPSFRGR